MTSCCCGIGGVGCASIMMSKHPSKQDDNELSTVTAVDVVEDRLQIAKELGATHVINSPEVSDVKAATHHLTDGEGFEAVIDCTALLTVF